jgi:mercuric reductase
MDTKKNNTDQSKVTLEITGMTCDHCAVSIGKRFEGKKGILNKHISYPNRSAEITFNPSLISKHEIIDTINATKQYQVTGDRSGNGSPGKHFDLIIIGGGSAAFSAAIAPEGLGLSALMVNARLPFGGTFVNVGCVPSKTLVRAAETVYHANHSNFDGIKPKGADIDFAKVIREKRHLVSTLQQEKYMEVVSDFENLQMIEGWAEFLDVKTILVNGDERYTALKFIIATGATTNVPQIEGLKEVGYLTNASLFDMEVKPESITIMGARYIGMEIAMAYNRLGVKVRVIEFTDRVLRMQTPDISAELEKHMKNEGIEILPNFRALKFEKSKNETVIHCRRPDGSVTKLSEPGKIIVASGIKPTRKSLGLTVSDCNSPRPAMYRSMRKWKPTYGIFMPPGM